MKQHLLLLLILAVSPLVGCNTLSPRLNEKFDNKNAKINGIESNQNALKLELARISNELGIQNSKIGEMQQGWANIKAGNNDNKGIQILQGDGPLILIFASITIGMLFYYVFESEKYKKTTNILATEIAKNKDPMLNHRVLLAAAHTDVEHVIKRLVS